MNLNWNFHHKMFITNHFSGYIWTITYFIFLQEKRSVHIAKRVSLAQIYPFKYGEKIKVIFYSVLSDWKNIGDDFQRNFVRPVRLCSKVQS